VYALVFCSLAVVVSCSLLCFSLILKKEGVRKKEKEEKRRKKKGSGLFF